MPSNKLGLGKILEQFTVAVNKSIGYRVLHNDFDNYSYNKYNSDVRDFLRNKQLANIECKNWRLLDRKYDLSTAQDEILDRFRDHAGGVKILVISFFEDMFTESAKQLILNSGIKVVELGKLIGRKDFHSQLFHITKSRIRKIIYNFQLNHRAKLGCSSHVSYSSLDRIDKIDRSNTLNTYENTNNIKTNNTILHTKNCSRNYALELVKRAIRLGQSYQSYG